MRQYSSITVVAEQAGVTKATVSRALRNKGGVSEETRDRILRVARDLNYWPSPARQGRGRVHTGHLGFVVISEDAPRLANEPGSSYLHDVLEGCRLAAEEQSNGLAICRLTIQQVQKGQMPAAMRSGHLDGIVLRGWWLPELARWISEIGVPCVLVDCDRFVPGIPQVQIESIQAMDDIVGHLTKHGAQNIATITGDMEHLNSQERLAGLQMALTRRGKSLPDTRIVIEHGYKEEAGRRGVQTLCERNIPFDAIVCQNDLIALGAMRELAAAGLSVPNDIKVVGFDNMEFAGLPEVGLTTIDACPHKLGEMGTNLLLEKLNGKNVDDVHLRVATRLIVRQSA